MSQIFLFACFCATCGPQNYRYLIPTGFEQEHSPETIQQQFPALSREEVYGAITFYLSHRDDVQVYLKRQDALWEKLRAEAEKRSNPVIKHLRALKAADVPDAS